MRHDLNGTQLLRKTVAYGDLPCLVVVIDNCLANIGCTCRVVAGLCALVDGLNDFSC